MDAFKAAYPTHPLRDGLYLNDRYGGFGAFGILDAMSGALAAFAYTGNPSTETLT